MAKIGRVELGEIGEQNVWCAAKGAMRMVVLSASHLEDLRRDLLEDEQGELLGKRGIEDLVGFLAQVEVASEDAFVGLSGPMEMVTLEEAVNNALEFLCGVRAGRPWTDPSKKREALGLMSFADVMEEGKEVARRWLNWLTPEQAAVMAPAGWFHFANTTASVYGADAMNFFERDHRNIVDIVRHALVKIHRRENFRFDDEDS